MTTYNTLAKSKNSLIRRLGCMARANPGHWVNTWCAVRHNPTNTLGFPSLIGVYGKVGAYCNTPLLADPRWE